MRPLLLPLTLLATACTDHELGTLTESEAVAAYATMKTRLQEVHSLVLGSERPPNEYQYGCTSGTIDLRISLDGEMEPQVLQHGFSSCEMDGLLFDGTIFYRDLDPCEGGAGLAMSVYGRIDLEGSMEGFCYIQARDNCGELSGHMCGFAAADLSTSAAAAAR